MNLNINSQEAILSNDLVIIPRVDKEKKTIKYEQVKRIIDIALGSLGLILLSPIFLLIAIVIKLDSKGPVFFAHTRIGKKRRKI